MGYMGHGVYRRRGSPDRGFDSRWGVSSGLWQGIHGQEASVGRGMVEEGGNSLKISLICSW